MIKSPEMKKLPGKSVLQKLWEKRLILEHAAKHGSISCVFAKDVSDGSGAILVGLSRNGSFTPLARLLTKDELDRMNPVFEADINDLFEQVRGELISNIGCGTKSWTPDFFEKHFPVSSGMTSIWWELANDVCVFLTEHFGKAGLWRNWVSGPKGEA